MALEYQPTIHHRQNICFYVALLLYAIVLSVSRLLSPSLYLSVPVGLPDCLFYIFIGIIHINHVIDMTHKTLLFRFTKISLYAYPNYRLS